MIDLGELWDFDDPSGSEQRLRAKLAGTLGPDRDVLQTQVARALGLQQRYAEALVMLDAIESRDPEAHVRVMLERGRVYRSSGDEAGAAPLFRAAVSAADTAGLEALAIDAMHMVALTLTGTDRVEYTRTILQRVRRSADPGARGWEASVLNNLGMAHSELGQWQAALDAFEDALAVRRTGTDEVSTGVARWMVAWALRNLGRTEEALVAQRALKADLSAAGREDPYVEEELALLEGP